MAVADRRRDDNPLWYDDTEADEPPGALILALAAVFAAMARVGTACASLHGRLPRPLFPAMRPPTSLRRRR